MLLVVNGDSAAERIERASSTGQTLLRREVLHESTVPAESAGAELGEAREGFEETMRETLAWVPDTNGRWRVTREHASSLPEGFAA